MHGRSAFAQKGHWFDQYRLQWPCSHRAGRSPLKAATEHRIAKPNKHLAKPNLQLLKRLSTPIRRENERSVRAPGGGVMLVYGTRHRPSGARQLDRARAPRVPVLRVTNGQSRSLQSSIAGYSQVSIFAGHGPDPSPIFQAGAELTCYHRQRGLRR